jgi:hypothetical protein
VIDSFTSIVLNDDGFKTNIGGSQIDEGTVDKAPSVWWVSEEEVKLIVTI